MAVELHPSDNGATLWSYAPTKVTISHRGGDIEKVFAKVTKLNPGLNDPNGRLYFLGLFKGLKVVSYRPWAAGDRSGALFRTAGGTVLRVEPHVKSFDLDEDAARLGLYTPEDVEEGSGKPIIYDDGLSVQLTNALGTLVRVRLDSDGGMTLIGQLDDRQKLMARALLKQWRQSK